MIYLDYSATTPVDKRVLDVYCNVTSNYIGNPNSKHKLGLNSKKALDDSTEKIAKILGCKPREIIFTSGASEGNATVMKGVAYKYCDVGNGIITTRLEHKSILEAASYLNTHGFNLSIVPMLPNGQVDLVKLKEYVNKNTILVSICGVNSETGFKQDLKAIRKVIKEKNPNTIFHSDLTQALGKTDFDLNDVDMATFSSHKIYGPKGIGILYKNRKIDINKLIYATNMANPYRGGTPPLPLIVSFSKALELMYKDLDKKIEKCKLLNKKLLDGLSKYPIRINSNETSVPQIVNFSLLKIDGMSFIKELEKYDIYVSTTTACSDESKSWLLFALTDGDESVSETSIRVSISHLTTEEEIDEFLKIFDKVYKKLINTSAD